jgi:protoporphyrinogen oxidase
VALLDQIPAKPWLTESIGERAYHVIWHPLLKVKFGDCHDQISAAWIWHRIWRVATSRRSMLEREVFGCLEHGAATLVDPLVAWLAGRNVVYGPFTCPPPSRATAPPTRTCSPSTPPC